MPITLKNTAQENNNSTTTPVLFALLPNTLMLDLVGPAEVLRLASQLEPVESGTPAPRFELSYIGPVAEVQTSIGLPIGGILPLPELLPEGAIIVIVGASSPQDEYTQTAYDEASATLASWLARTVNPERNRLICVCAGALIAARAGLLDGRQCTTHHDLCATLQALAPTAKVLENRLYVSDGPVSTSAGITAGIDLTLQLLAELAGPRVASAVARRMVVYMRRAGADPQLSPWTTGRNHLHPALHRVQDAISADPTRSWSADHMAQIACSSTRHVARLFNEYAGISPVDYVNRLRVAVARELISQSSLDMEVVAERVGFGSARHLRRIWTKYEAGAPSDYRGERA